MQESPFKSSGGEAFSLLLPKGMEADCLHPEMASEAGLRFVRLLFPSSSGQKAYPSMLEPPYSVGGNTLTGCCP